jgi:thiamine-phosphate pyrophosphorylase
LIIKDRLDIALAVRAAGVHLGQHDLPCIEARRIAGKQMIIGLSVETVEQARNAEGLEVDYLGVGPIFPTPTKTDAAKPIGLAGLQEVHRHSQHKLVAIGGINFSNAQAVREAGADGIAVVSAICAAANPRAAAMELRKI